MVLCPRNTQFVAAEFSVDPADRYGVELLARLIRMAEQWAGGLMGGNRCEEAVRLLEKVLRLAPGNERLTAVLDFVYRQESREPPLPRQN